MENPIIENIKERRSVHHFKEESVDEEKIQLILESGKWAPSWDNVQPWRFIVVKDQETKKKIMKVAPTIYNKAIRKAPVSIITCVDPEEDPYHYIEDGAIATQNMALAAKGLGLDSTWIGFYDLSEEGGSSEEELKEALEIPDKLRVISVLPIGYSDETREGKRKDLSDLILKEI